MPKKRKADLVQSQHYTWRLSQRNGVWSADGRSNAINVGRHSLGTRHRVEALQLLAVLDENVHRQQLAGPRSALDLLPTTRVELSLAEGRKLYEEYIRRPRVAGGVRKSTQKRYRTVFDKFLKFAELKEFTTWSQVNKSVLDGYLTHLNEQGYAGKTLKNEATTLVVAQKWLMEAGHLAGVDPLKLKLRRIESQRPYCYTPEQVKAMVDHCAASTERSWLGDVIVGLACTGLRISELAALRWTDVDLATGMLTLTDESGRASLDRQERRELKSGRSRSLPIHLDFASVIARMPKKSVHVFRGPRGGVLKPDTIRNILVREVVKPLQSQFPSPADQQGFKDGRLHSFRHYFASMCATSGIPERVAMDWLGHQDSEMVRHYFHLHDDEAKRQMEKLNLIHGAASSTPETTGNPSTGISSDGKKKDSRSQRTTSKTMREKASPLC